MPVAACYPVAGTTSRAPSRGRPSRTRRRWVPTRGRARRGTTTTTRRWRRRGSRAWPRVVEVRVELVADVLVEEVEGDVHGGRLVRGFEKATNEGCGEELWRKSQLARFDDGGICHCESLQGVPDGLHLCSGRARRATKPDPLPRGWIDPLARPVPPHNGVACNAAKAPDDDSRRGSPVERATRGGLWRGWMDGAGGGVACCRGSSSRRGGVRRKRLRRGVQRVAGGVWLHCSVGLGRWAEEEEQGRGGAKARRQQRAPTVERLESLPRAPLCTRNSCRMPRSPRSGTSF